jgi:hypothetical protein
MIYFVKTDYEYQPYQDFWNIVKLSGFEVIPFSQMDVNSDNTYICTPLNGEWKEGWTKPKARIIWWDLEWNGYTTVQERPEGVSEVWASCPHYARISGARYVPLGSHKDLWKCYDSQSDGEIKYDVALMAYRDPHRRRVMISQLCANFNVAPDAWDKERDAILWASRLMVNIHQHGYLQSVAPVRMAIAAAYRLPVLCENVIDRGILSDCVVYTHYDRIIDNTRYLLSHDMARDSFASALHETLCLEYSFNRNIKDALK